MPLFEADLNGKIALVTGGAQGLGKAEALALASAGANVSLVDIDLAQCEQTVRELALKSGRRVIAVKADVRAPAEVQHAVDTTTNILGGLHILVNNAGVLVRKEILDLTAEEWDWVMGVNVKGVFLCSQAAARQMIRQGQGGKIVNISSVAGFLGEPTRGAYCTSKGGVNQLTKVLAVEFAQHGICVNGVAPGIVAGGVAASLGTDQPEPLYVDLVNRISLKRRATPEEIAAIVVFLASSAADYITGQTILVDGGLTVH